MNYQEIFDELSIIQAKILSYLDSEEKDEEVYEDIKKFFDEIKLYDNPRKLKLLLYLISKISNNHHRSNNFFDKIEQIFNLLKNDILKHFPKSELFHIFKKNRRILLFLFESKIITIDEDIFQKIIKCDFGFQQYFLTRNKTVFK